MYKHNESEFSDVSGVFFKIIASFRYTIILEQYRITIFNLETCQIQKTLFIKYVKLQYKQFTMQCNCSYKYSEVIFTSNF